MHKAKARFAGVQGASARPRGDSDVAGHGASLSVGKTAQMRIVDEAQK